MGKRLLQQRRGRGSPTYQVASHHFKGVAKHCPVDTKGVVIDFVHCPGHTAPLMDISFLSGDRGLTIAPEGVKIGDVVSVGGSEVKEGNVLYLKDIPEGTIVHNIELQPGDGGKVVRASGTYAKVVSKTEDGIRVKLPSRKEKLFLPDCRAAIGIVAGAGRPDKPYLKAGTRFKRMRALGKLYSRVCGISMNAVDHPFGGKNSHIKGRPTQSSRNDPPGRKVGKIAPRRTGRKTK